MERTKSTMGSTITSMTPFISFFSKNSLMTRMACEQSVVAIRANDDSVPKINVEFEIFARQKDSELPSTSRFGTGYSMHVVHVRPATASRIFCGL